mgnify:CR=1 FL=1
MTLKKIIISGGGTGGHIFPAIAIADALQQRWPDVDVLFVGASNRMEMQKVPAVGYRIKGLWVSGLQRRLTVKNLLFPVKLMVSLVQSLIVLLQFKPDVAIGTGGFASGPLLFVATLKNMPSLIQEQNSFPGITNKFLANRVNAICVAYPKMDRFFPKSKVLFTGNPIRKNLTVASDPAQSKINFGFDPSAPVLLVLGGSLGAKRINELLQDKALFIKESNYQILWQCGELYYSQYQLYSNGSNIRVVDFIKDMGQAYAAADIIISRAGALAVSELCVVGKPVIFIPSPNVAEDHQTKNAQSLVDAGAAMMIKEKDLATQFEPSFHQLISDVELQNTLRLNMKKLAKTDAAERIVDAIEKLVNL